MSTNKSVKYFDQHGVVSVVVSVIIMIVLTLIAVAFAQIMRREQRQALDRQLSSQAYYAAESAINDAAYALSLDPTSLEALTGSDCIDTTSGPLSQGSIDGSNGTVEYSCVTIDSTPGELRYDSIKVDESIQVELQPIDAAGSNGVLESLQVQWREQLGNDNLENIGAGTIDLPAEWPVQRPGVLRLEVVPVVNSVLNPYSRDDLVNDRKVFWLYPSDDSSAGAVTSIPWSSPSGTIVAGLCNDVILSDGQCNMEITGMPGSTNTTYIVRLRTVYRDVETTINGRLVGGVDARFKGAQVQVDATGRANDVLRRISARIAVEQTSALPEYLLQSYTEVCKQLEVVNANDVTYSCTN